MAARRSKEERAAAAEERAMVARAEAEAVKRPEVAVLWRAVKGIDALTGAPNIIERLARARTVCVEVLDEFGVTVSRAGH